MREAVLLRVAKQTSVPSPEVPRRFIPWLVIDGRDPDVPPSTQLTRRNLPLNAVPGPDDLWTNDPLCLAALKAWIDTTWTPWAEDERQRRRVQSFYERLFERYLQLKRDGEQVELVWGYGLLSWQVDGENVWHPLIVGRVEMAFDRTVGTVLPR